MTGTAAKFVNATELVTKPVTSTAAKPVTGIPALAPKSREELLSSIQQGQQLWIGAPFLIGNHSPFLDHCPSSAPHLRFRHDQRMETVRERVLEALRLATRPLDADELSVRLDVRPRQTVNQVARKLESDGLLRRVSGPDGKLVNVLVDDAGVSSPVVVELGTGHEPPPGDSREQRAAERQMLDALGRDLGGLTLEPARIVIDDVRVEVDGADAGRTVLVECWAHQGTVKPAQKNKVLSDALKLTWVASRLPVHPRLILCMSDPVAAAPFSTAQSWTAAAFRDLEIEVRVVSLTEETRQGVQDAQTRQYR